MLSQKFIEEMKQALLAKQQELQDELKGISGHTEIGDDLDAQVQEVETDEVNQDVIAAIKADLVKIETALARIQNGTYGVDEDGNEIPEERLKVLPWADRAI